MSSVGYLRGNEDVPSNANARDGQIIALRSKRLSRVRPESGFHLSPA
jgi:hypothetical protein